MRRHLLQSHPVPRPINLAVSEFSGGERNQSFLNDDDQSVTTNVGSLLQTDDLGLLLLTLPSTTVIAEATLYLLEQHGAYSESDLCTYLAKQFPEIPESWRLPIVVSSTTAARQAAVMHVVCEANADSPGPYKRAFASQAKSALSFWALGLRALPRGAPPLRSESVPEADRETVQLTVVDSAAPGPENLLHSREVPVPIAASDSGFLDFYASVSDQDASGSSLETATTSGLLAAPRPDMEASSSAVPVVLADNSSKTVTSDVVTATAVAAPVQHLLPANLMDQSDNGQRRAAEQIGDITHDRRSTTPLRLSATPVSCIERSSISSAQHKTRDRAAEDHREATRRRPWQRRDSRRADDRRHWASPFRHGHALDRCTTPTHRRRLSPSAQRRMDFAPPRTGATSRWN